LNLDRLRLVECSDLNVLDFSVTFNLSISFMHFDLGHPFLSYCLGWNADLPCTTYDLVGCKVSHVKDALWDGLSLVLEVSYSRLLFIGEPVL